MSSTMAMQKETIIKAALQLLQEQGIEGVTLRKLMKPLNVGAPAIYWRFKEKRELLEAMAEAILQEQFADFAPYQKGETTWQNWLVATLNRLRYAMLAYPDGARVVAGARPHKTPTLGSITEYALRALEEEGINLQMAATVVYTALHYTFGHVIEEQESPDLEAKREVALNDFHKTYPAISRLLALPQTEASLPEAVYNAGLNLIIKGCC